MYEFKSRMEKYYNHDELQSKNIGGHVDKTFARVDDNISSYNRHCEESEKNMTYPRPKTVKDSRYFAELFEALQSGNSSYVTIYNDLVTPPDKTDRYLPKYVSCLIKEFSNEARTQIQFDQTYIGFILEPIYCEVVGSRLANALGIKTVYNTPISQYEASIFGDYPKYDTVLSIDFVKDGDFTRLFTDFFKSIPMTDVLMHEEALILLDRTLMRIGAWKDIPNWREFVDKTKRELVMQGLFKWLLCGDLDSDAKNYGITIYTSKNPDTGEMENTLGMGAMPCLDYELIMGFVNNPYVDVQARAVFENLSKNMPDVIDEFMTRVLNLRNSGELDDILKNSMIVPPIVYENKIPMMHKSIEKLEGFWKESVIMPK
ncbi:MAG: hypothetical protein E7356_01135 [Clostridiales bacterium]|nr:hypothetical protein [Clostridiales bacterium]